MEKKTRNIVLIVLLSILCGGLNAQEGYLVRNIKFKGNKKFSENTLLEQTYLYEINLFEKYILREKHFRYSQELVNSAFEDITQFYQRHGFLYAKVSRGELRIDHRKREIKKLNIIIDEGPAIETGKIRYKIDYNAGNDSREIGSIIEDIKKNTKLHPQTRFTDEEFEKDRELIIDSFKEKGYFYVDAAYDLQINKDSNIVNIIWQIEPGPEYVFGQTTVKGNEHVSTDFILRQLAYQQGYTFKEKLIQNTEQNIYDLGLFRVVKVRGIYSKKDGTRIPVEIEVNEAPRLNTQIGVGYGTEDEFRTNIDLRRLSLFGGARRIELSARHSALELYNINLRYVQPQFISSRAHLIINPFIRRDTEPGYETRRAGLNLPITYKIPDDLHSSLNFYTERVLQEVSQDDPERGDASSGEYLYNKTGFVLDNEWNTMTPLFFPEKGVFVHLSYKLNGYIFESNFNYMRLLLDFRNYQRIGAVILAAKFKVGGIQSGDNTGFIPVEDRFYTGGSMSIRGWPRSKLGPMLKGNPIGGKSMIESSLELRYPIYGKLSGTIFTDAGNVWESSYSYHFNEFRYSVGIGLRYRIPIGPVRVDLARPIYDKKKTFQLHINIGQAF
jgi:outer membrane protein insertion porin family